MFSEDFRVDQIYRMGPINDATGRPAINGTSFDVGLIGCSSRLRIEVAVTSVAHNQLQALGFSDEDAVRAFVETLLAASSDDKWKPDTCPWLTVDSYSMDKLLEDLKSTAVSLTTGGTR
ncbi:MAG: hypothetical protein WBQ72_13480 [Terriglobales bacterium]|jgi:hypothetical protein